MRARRTALWLVVLPLACSPSATPKPKDGVKTASSNSTTKSGEPQPESPARWVMRASRDWRPTSKLTVGAATVYAGKGGERWFGQKGGGRLSHAIKLVPEDIDAISQLAGKYLFAGSSGTIYTASEALGPIVSSNPPPSEMRWVSAGRASFVGVTTTGELLRTIDGGLKWTKPSGPPKGNGVLVRVALDGSGNGLALMAPQRVFLTKDDGDSWTPLSTPGIGAMSVVTDTTGTVYLMGNNEYATLSGGGLTSSTNYPRFELPLKPGGDDDEPGYAKVYALSGNRYVEAFPHYEPSSATNKWKVRAGAFGTTPKAQVVPGLDGCNEVQLAAWDNTIVLACDIKTNAPMPGNPPGVPSYPRTESTRFIRSDDFGVTFKDDTTVESAEPRWSPASIAVGPNGWLFINTRCHWTKKGNDCLPARIRVPGSDSFQTMTVGGLPVGGSPKKNGWSSDLEIRKLHFSPARGMVYALVNRRGEHRVYAAKLGETDFVRKLDSELDSGWGESALSVEDDGTINLMARDQGLWTIRRAKDDGSINQSLVVPIEFDKVELHGRRGLGFDMTGKAWETADSGQHWTEVAAPVDRGEPRFIACTNFGCMLDGKLRVGWDLPSAASGKTIAAVPAIEAVKPTYGRRGKPIVTGKPAWSTPLKCAVKEHWTPIGPWAPQYGQWLPGAPHADVAPGIRWMVSKKGEAGRVSAVIAVPAAKPPPTATKLPLTTTKGLLTKEFAILGPEPEDEKLMQTTKDLTRSGALVAVRYVVKRKEGVTEATYGGYKLDDKDLSPVDVEIGWFDAATQKTHKGNLKNLAPFRVPFKSSYDTALVWPVKGGLWFHAQIRESYVDKGPLFFVKDDGKVEKMTWPEQANNPASFGVDRVGSRIVIYQVQDSYNGQLQMFWSSDSGATWTKRHWGIAPGNEIFRRYEETRRVELQSIDSLFDKLVIGASWAHAKTEVAFAVPLTNDNDPPEVFVLPAQKTLSDPPKVCDATTSTGGRTIAHYAGGTRHPVIITGETEKGYIQAGTSLVLATGTSVMRVPKTGSACVSAYEIGRESGAQFGGILAPNDMSTASLFYRDTSSLGGTILVTRPMSCAWEAGPLPEDLQEDEGFVE